jgi:hypothetical protein
VIERRTVPVLGVLVASMTGCAMRPAMPTTHGIDHVVLAISDLDRGIEQLGEICGVRPVRGGEHGHTGTENALLSMGPGAYLEVLAPLDGVQLPPELQPLRTVTNLMPVSWAVATRNADLTSQMLRAHGYTVSEPQAGSRETPEGNVIRWRTFQLTAPKIEGAPFFIEWDAETAHPATTSPLGCPLLSLELHTPHDEQLRRLMRLLNAQGEITHGETSRMQVTLQGSRAPVRLPAGS